MSDGSREWLRFGAIYLGLILAALLVAEAWGQRPAEDWMRYGLPLFALLGGLALWKVPQWQTRHLERKGVDDKDRHQLADANRRTIMQMLGGVFLIVGVYNTVGTLNVAREGQITDRFATAIEQLGAVDSDGAPQMELRLGAIYSLERIARDSPRDHWTIMEVLTGYVRRHAPLNGEAQNAGGVRADIQAILTVVGRRETTDAKGRDELGPIDLRHCALAGANLRGANLRGADLLGSSLASAVLVGGDFAEADLTSADLFGAQLYGANLARAKLVGADFGQSSLQEARLPGAQLDSASFVSAELSGADFSDASLRGANFVGANLTGAGLSRARLTVAVLETADMRDTILREASLAGAFLNGANMEGADVRGADLRRARDLTQEQIAAARGDGRTELPEWLGRPAHWDE